MIDVVPCNLVNLNIFRSQSSKVKTEKTSTKAFIKLSKLPLGSSITISPGSEFFEEKRSIPRSTYIKRRRNRRTEKLEISLSDTIMV